MLWKLTPPGGGAPSYLFGTMHVRDVRAFSLLKQVYRCIDACDALALEFDLGEVTAQMDPALLQLPEGQSLDQLIPEKKWQKLRAFLRKAAGVDLVAFRRMLPLMTVNVINEWMMGRERPVALDEQLWRYAKSQSKAILGIETYEEQIKILRSIPLEQQIQSLLWLGRNIRSHRRHLKKMTALYQAGDIYRLHRAAKRSASGMRHLLLYRRNAIMAERILAFIQEQTVCCAIGAGHLAGGKGVLRLLKHKGVGVEHVG